MRIITKHQHHANPGQMPSNDAPKAILPFETRRRSRQIITLDNDEQVGIILNQGTVLRNNDLLIDDNGQAILVQAALEPVLRVTASSSQQLMRAAYHLGNRHVAVEIGPDYLQLEPDTVLADMLDQLGDLNIAKVDGAFEPETGAYGGGHKHGHDETFDEDYALAQAAFAAREPDAQ